MATVNLGMEFLQNTTLPHKVNSETILRLDTFTKMRLVDVEVTSPVGLTPSLGDSYHISSGQPGGAFAGQSQVIATWAHRWTFSPIRIGTKAFIESRGAVQIYRLSALGTPIWSSAAGLVNLSFSIPNPTYSLNSPLNYYPLFKTGATPLELLQVRAKVYGGTSLTVGMVSPFASGSGHPFSPQFQGSHQVVSQLALASSAVQANQLAIVDQPSPLEWVSAQTYAISGTPTLLVIDFVVSAAF